MELEQLQAELDSIKKENEALRQENKMLVQENSLLRQNQAKPSNAIVGFSIVKQGKEGKYYAAAKRIKGKIHRIYLGKSKEGAEKKLKAYLEKIGYKSPSGSADQPDNIGDLFANVVEEKPLLSPADQCQQKVNETRQIMQECKQAALHYVEAIQITFPDIAATAKECLDSIKE